MNLTIEANTTTNHRLELCKLCKYSRKYGEVLLGVHSPVTCGVFMVGETIMHEGEKVQLCGCLMQVKTLIPASTCPINKW